MEPATGRPAPDRRRALGAYGEQLAARYLQDQGMAVIDRNWRCARGEIDLVARDGDCLVFCEVKTRRTSRFGSAVEAVDGRKAVRLRALAAAWLQVHDVRAQRVRIDVIGILRPGAGPARLCHLVGVGA
ncbi:YraN family protein [Pedococcus ginsenosidimutans]|jgi:putative endonuclease